MRATANAEQPLDLLLDLLRLLIHDASLAGSTCSGSYGGQKSWLAASALRCE
jgi:hypothetical protein